MSSRGLACLQVIGLVVFSGALFAPILCRPNLVAAQAAATNGSAEPVAQSGESPSPQGVIRITVNLVQVDAIVTDSKGRHVTNLQPSDFEILEDGRPQTITNFLYISIASPAGIETHAAIPFAGNGIPAVPPARMRPEQVRRSIVILVDDLHIPFENVVYVRKALKRFIDNDVQPGDLVAILHTSGGLGVRQQFTNNKRVLHATVDRLQYYLFRASGPRGKGLVDGVDRGKGGLEAFRKDFYATVQSDGTFRQKATTIGTMDALEYVLRGLRDVPGRKAVFLVSEGFPLCTSRLCRQNEVVRDVAEGLRDVADLANRSAAVVYTMSTQGLPTLSVDASMGPPAGVTDGYWSQIAQSSIRNAYIDAQSSLAYLARQTEGLFLHDTNDLAGGMREMMDDLSGYYLIGYKPSAESFKEDEKAGRDFHRIQVKVKVRGLRVRTRPGFFGIPDGETRPVHRTAEEQLRAAVVSPFATSGIRIQLAPQFLNKGSKESVARLRLHIDARDLTFQNARDGSKNGIADLVAVAYGENGAVGTGFKGVLKGFVPAGEFEAVHERGVDYRLDLPIKEPGGYQVRVAVRDPASEKVGSASQFIEVPKLRPDRLALSGIVLNATALGESGPAMRRFKADDRVSYELEIYNARRASAAEGPNLESKIQILHEGRLVSEQNAGVTSQVPGDSKRLVMSGEFVLSPNTTPGDYALLVTVTDKLAPPRHSTAHQWIDFEVVP
jgi:VWFA-related protein